METQNNPSPEKHPSNFAFLIAIIGLLSLTVGADMLVSHGGWLLGLALVIGGVGLVIYAVRRAGAGRRSR